MENVIRVLFKTVKIVSKDIFWYVVARIRFFVLMPLDGALSLAFLCFLGILLSSGCFAFFYTHNFILISKILLGLTCISIFGVCLGLFICLVHFMWWIVGKMRIQKILNHLVGYVESVKRRVNSEIIENDLERA